MRTNAAAIFSIALFTTEAAELTVRYYNEAQVSAKALAVAVETANLALRQAGITARWVDCYADASACRYGDEFAVVELTIAVTAKDAPAFSGTTNFTMGVSLLPEKGTGVHAKVLWNRVTRYAKAYDVPAARVLGFVMAHEIGHLLMNTGAHSREGIMKAGWSGKDISLLAGRRLAFQGHEAAMMRRQLASR